MKIVFACLLFSILFSSCHIPTGISVSIENTDVLHIENSSNNEIEKFDTIRVDGYYSTIFFESYQNADIKALDFIPKEHNKRIEELIIKSDLREGLILDLCRYENLKTLDLSSCSLPTKYKLKCPHPNVVSLDLSRNTLDAIPSMLYQFPNIKNVSLKNNYIDKFSLDLYLLPSLNSIDIRNNPIEAKADSLRNAHPNITFVTVK